MEKQINSVGDARAVIRALIDHKYFVSALNAQNIVAENATRDRFYPSKYVEDFSIVSTAKIKPIETSIKPSTQSIVDEPINTKLAEKINSVVVSSEQPKKKWVFTVNRSAGGLIESIEVTEK